MGTLRKLVWDIRSIERKSDIKILETDDLTVALANDLPSDVKELYSATAASELRSIYRDDFVVGLIPDHTAWVDWLSAQRERLKRIYIEKASQKVCDLQTDQKSLREEATRLFEVDGQNEAAVRALMFCDRQANDIDGVTGTYARLKSALRDRAAEPAPETAMLYFRLTSSERGGPEAGKPGADPGLPTICIPSSRPAATTRRPRGSPGPWWST